jgi:hypothetical protein
VVQCDLRSSAALLPIASIKECSLLRCGDPRRNSRTKPMRSAAQGAQLRPAGLAKVFHRIDKVVPCALPHLLEGEIGGGVGLGNEMDQLLGGADYRAR